MNILRYAHSLYEAVKIQKHLFGVEDNAQRVLGHMEKDSHEPARPKYFDGWEISGVYEDKEENYCERVEDDSEASFFSLYGHYQEGHVACVGDFATREAAEQVLSSIIGAPLWMTYKIRDRKGAENFLQLLVDNGMDYHLEDDPAYMQRNGIDGPYLFTTTEANFVRERVAECYRQDWGSHQCPIGFILSITNNES